MNEVRRVLFSSSGDGRWFRREWSLQCPVQMWRGRRCQGVCGHNGVHWTYRADGAFEWEDNEDDSSEDGCSGTVPPGHEHYWTPEEMTHRHYMNRYEDSEVTDPVKIARLEAGETEIHESLTRPVSEDKLAAMVAAGKLELPTPRNYGKPKVE